MNDDDLKQALARLRGEYTDQLPGTVAQMEDLWRRLLAAEGSSSQLEDLVRIAHSVAGSGTTFGVPAATRAARELELLLDPFRQNGGLPDVAGQASVAALLAELRRAAVEH